MIKDLFLLDNLTLTAGKLGAPWEFSFDPASISEKARKDKKERQVWIKNPALKHCFYSGLIGQSELVRVSKENGPRKFVAFAADYDCTLSDERIKEAIAEMEVKPAFVETSIGGHRRLIWVFEIPIHVDTREFAVFILQKAKKWLRLELLPMLDEPAWEDPSRLLCCGDKWEPTGYGAIPTEVSQAFFVSCGKEFRFRSTEDINIGLDVVEAECKKRFPETFDWPGEFSIGSQGPSFWIKDSISKSSAIVKPDGMFTFAAHADKSFHTWADILGKEFMAAFATTSIAKATADIWFDGQKYHRKNQGIYISMKKEEFQNYLRVDCKLSAKPDNSGTSAIDQALAHIHSNQRIAGAAPFVPLPVGITIFQSRRCLNIYDGKVIEPQVGTASFGPKGEFPFLSQVLWTQYYPREQFEHLITWMHYYYTGVLEKICRPGPMVISAGPPGCGKTFISRSLIGLSVGGFCDAASFIIGGNQFNSELFSVPHWSLDDDTPNASQHASGHAHMNMKKLLANDVFMFSKKYEVPCPIQWGGRLMASCNLNETSMRLIGPVDDDMACRVMLLRCSEFGEQKDNFTFPSRTETWKLLEAERRACLRWIHDWKVPDHIERDGRYGYVPYKEASLLDKATQSSPAASFKEAVFETLVEWFRQNPETPCWRGSSAQVLQLLDNDPRNHAAMRSMKLDRVNGHMEQLEREKIFNCHAETDPKTRIRLWVFNCPTT